MVFETEMEAWLLGTGCCNMLQLHTGSTLQRHPHSNSIPHTGGRFEPLKGRGAAVQQVKLEMGRYGIPWYPPWNKPRKHLRPKNPKTLVFQVRTVGFREVNHHITCILSGWDPSEKASQTSMQAIHRGENHGQCKMLIKFRFLFS